MPQIHPIPACLHPYAHVPPNIAQCGMPGGAGGQSGPSMSQVLPTAISLPYMYICMLLLCAPLPCPNHGCIGWREGSGFTWLARPRVTSSLIPPTPPTPPHKISSLPDNLIYNDATALHFTCLMACGGALIGGALGPMHSLPRSTHPPLPRCLSLSLPPCLCGCRCCCLCGPLHHDHHTHICVLTLWGRHHCSSSPHLRQAGYHAVLVVLYSPLHV